MRLSGAFGQPSAHILKKDDRMNNVQVASTTCAPEEVPPKPRSFDPYIIPASSNTQAMVCSAVKEIETYEMEQGIRIRKRSEAAHLRFERSVTALLCGAAVAYRSLSGPVRAIKVRKEDLERTKDRYKPPYMTATFRDDIKLLNKLGWLVFNKGDTVLVLKEGQERNQGYFKALTATIQAGSKLVAWIDQHQVTAHDFTTDLALHQPIMLRGPKEGRARGNLIPFEDTPETDAMVDQIRSINQRLGQASIGFDIDRARELYEAKSKPIGELPDWSAQRVVRIFNNGSFEQGGRLYSGFWETLPKEVRRRCLTIESEGIAEVDFHAMNINLLYGMEGEAPPEGDLYDIGLKPSSEYDQRAGTKKVFMSMFNTERPLEAMPRGCRVFFPQSVKVEDVVEAIRAKHPKIAHHLGANVGMQLQRLESDIMVKVLLKLQSLGAHALPIHDGCMVPVSKAEIAKQVMEEQFYLEMGQVCTAEIEVYDHNQQ